MSAALIHLSRRRTVLALLTLILVGFMVLIGTGHPLWRRFLLRHAYSEWKPLSPAPFKVFEAAVATVGKRVFVFGGFRNAQIQASSAVWAYDAGADSWSRRRNMPVARTHANAVVLNGAVWFAGGFIGDNPGPATDQVWRYDPVTDQWSEGPALPAPRAGGALVALAGQLHYFGGYTEDRETGSGDHWVLDPSGTAPTAWRPLSPMPVPRGHLGGYAVDGALFAVGGCIGHDPYPRDVALVHRYDPVTDRWTAVASLPEARSHFEPSSFVRDGRIVVIGGRARPSGDEAVAAVTEYDPRLDRWFALTPLPEPRHSPIAALTPNGIIAGVGGVRGSDPRTNQLWRFDEAGKEWSAAPPLPSGLGEVAAGVIGDRLYLVGDGPAWTLAYDLASGRWDAPDRHAVRPAQGNHHAAEVWNGKLYLVGGLDRGEGQLQIYDPVLEIWSLGPPLPFRAGSVATAMIDGQLYAVGGVVADSTTRAAARFDPVTERWSPIAPMPLARNHAAAATDGRRLFLFGGRGPGSGAANVVANGFADVQIYDPATDHWTASGGGESGAPASLPQARGGMGKAVYLHGEFWVFGGETLNGAGASRAGVYSRVDIYDPVANLWRSGPPMPTARHGIYPVTAGGRIMVFGGGDRAGHSVSTAAEILTPRASRTAPP